MHAVYVASVTLLCAALCYAGEGERYTLNVVEDVWIERSTSNYNHYRYLIVGKHPGYPIKRSLVKFQDVPNSCNVVNHAMMYLYYWYSHKASWQSTAQAPFITRTIQAHRVYKPWKESEASTIKRGRRSYWSQPYLGLDDTDANDCPTGEVKIYADRPTGFVEVDVTSAMKDWKAGKPNYGLLLLATNEDVDGRDTRFASKTDTDPKKHPYIKVNCD